MKNEELARTVITTLARQNNHDVPTTILDIVSFAHTLIGLAQSTATIELISKEGEEQ